MHRNRPTTTTLVGATIGRPLLTITPELSFVRCHRRRATNGRPYGVSAISVCSPVAIILLSLPDRHKLIRRVNISQNTRLNNIRRKPASVIGLPVARNLDYNLTKRISALRRRSYRVLLECVRRELHYLVYGAVRGVDRSVSERHFLVYLSVPLQSHYAYRACEVARVDVETVELIDSRYVLRAYQSLEVVIVDLLLLVADFFEALEILVELFLRQDETELRETLLKRVSARVLAENDLRRLLSYVLRRDYLGRSP